MPTIKYALDECGIATITFDRDEKRNAFNKEMAQQALQRLEQAEEELARVVILRANPGVRVWCAGHDLSELDPRAQGSENPTLALVEKIQSTPLPVIAMVEGHVYAGGLIVLLGADIVVAAENAQVAITSNKLGIPLPTELYAYWLRVMGLHKAKELLFTAAPISAREAYNAGLYNHVVEVDQLEGLTAEIAAKILECAPEAVANTKYQLNLISRRSSLTDEDRQDIQQRNSEILNSPQTQARISALLASLRGSRPSG